MKKEAQISHIEKLKNRRTETAKSVTERGCNREKYNGKEEEGRKKHTKIRKRGRNIAYPKPKDKKIT